MRHLPGKTTKERIIVAAIYCYRVTKQIKRERTRDLLICSIA